MIRPNDKKLLVRQICLAAQKYKKYLLGKSFLYIFEGHYFEVLFRKKDFLHMCGVDSVLSATQFFKDAACGKLQPAQISFSRRHPYDLARKKITQLADLYYAVEKDVFMLEDLKTNTFTYQFAVADLDFTLCLSKDLDQWGERKSKHYIVRSLRVEDSFQKASKIYEVQLIVVKEQQAKKYSAISYRDEHFCVETLPKEVQDLLSEELLAALLRQERDS